MLDVFQLKRLQQAFNINFLRMQSALVIEQAILKRLYESNIIKHETQLKQQFIIKKIHSARAPENPET